MQDEDRHTNEQGETEDNAPAESGAPGKPETPWSKARKGAAGAEQEAGDPLEALQAENEALKDQHLRTLAEMENLRRRTARELEDARAYAIANFARDVLAVSDNLQRALDALPESERGGADPALIALFQGVEMTERDLQQTLEKHQVRRIDPQGERFDPNFHQAMFEVEDPGVPAGTVVQVMQSGYVIGERVLRPAMVGVSKGGPKPAAKGDDANAGSDSQRTAGEDGGPDEPGPADAQGQARQHTAHGPKHGAGAPEVGARVDKSA